MKRKKIFLAIMVVEMILSFLPVFAQEIRTEGGTGMIYYLDSLHGSDDNDGSTPETAYQTLERINGMMLSAHTKVLLKAGSVFFGTLAPVREDSEGFIEIDRYGEGPDPIINGNGNFAAGNLKNLSYIKIANLEVTNIAPEADRTRCGVYSECGGEDTQGGNFKEIYLSNINVHDVTSVYSRTGGGIVFDTRKAAQPVTYENVFIENCRIKDTNANGITFTSAYSKRIGIDWAEMPYTPSKNIVIRNNFVYNCGGDGVFQSCAIDPLIERNVVYGCCWAGDTAYAGIWPHNSANAIMQYNEAYGQALVGGDAQGYDVDINCDNTLVQYNYSHHNDGGFLLICTSGDQGGYNDDVTVRHNLSEEDKGQIFTLSGPITNIKIYNNTVSSQQPPNTRLIGMYQWGNSGGGPNHVSVENNIFSMNGTGFNQFYPDTEYQFRGNLYYGTYNFSDISDSEKKMGDPGFAGDDPIYGISNGSGFRLTKSSVAYQTAKPSQFDDIANEKEMINIGAFS